MCCVMPPASPCATLLDRSRSSSVVLPWSTWPMIVTTGGRSGSELRCSSGTGGRGKMSNAASSFATATTLNSAASSSASSNLSRWSGRTSVNPIFSMRNCSTRMFTARIRARLNTETRLGRYTSRDELPLFGGRFCSPPLGCVRAACAGGACRVQFLELGTCERCWLRRGCDASGRCAPRSGRSPRFWRKRSDGGRCGLLALAASAVGAANARVHAGTRSGVRIARSRRAAAPPSRTDAIVARCKKTATSKSPPHGRRPGLSPGCLATIQVVPGRTSAAASGNGRHRSCRWQLPRALALDWSGAPAPTGSAPRAGACWVSPVRPGGCYALFPTPLHIPVVHTGRVHLHRGDLVPQKAQVLLGVLEVLLGARELLPQQLNRVVQLVGKHHVRTEPQVHALHGIELRPRIERVVQLVQRLDRLRLVPAPLEHLDHVERLANVGDLLLQPLAPLRGARLHKPVLAAHVSRPRSHASTRTRSPPGSSGASASHPPRHCRDAPPHPSAVSVAGQHPYPPTTNGAAGIPRGFTCTSGFAVPAACPADIVRACAAGMGHVARPWRATWARAESRDSTVLQRRRRGRRLLTIVQPCRRRILSGFWCATRTASS